MEKKSSSPNTNRGIVLWFTGLSGSGKTTIASELKKILANAGKLVSIIDGDTIRNKEHKHLGFSREDIKTNNCLIAELAKKEAENHDFVLVPVISPYQEDRANARLTIGPNFFIELFINAPLEKCIERDTKGLYQKALNGEINNLIGLNSSNPYEIPTNPDLEINTVKNDVSTAVANILSFLKSQKML